MTDINTLIANYERTRRLHCQITSYLVLTHIQKSPSCFLFGKFSENCQGSQHVKQFFEYSKSRIIFIFQKTDQV